MNTLSLQQPRGFGVSTDVCMCLYQKISWMIVWFLFFFSLPLCLCSELLISWLEPDLHELEVEIGAATAVQRI